jgi:hypothetical protein
VISTNDVRALELYELALSLVETKGTPGRHSWSAGAEI